MVNVAKLNKLASNNSKWIEEAKERQKNRAWQVYSQKIAIKVLKAIRENNIKQKQLAEMIGVSPQQINKIVKGKENLTLKTIAKLENALNIELIFEKPKDTDIVYKEIIKKEHVYLTVYSTQKTIAQQKLDYSLKYDGFTMVMENLEKSANYG